MALLGTGHASAVLGARRCCSDGSCVLARVADVPSGQMTIMETRPKQGCVTELYWGCQMLPGQPGHLRDSSGHKERSLAKVLGWRTGSSGGSSHPNPILGGLSSAASRDTRILQNRRPTAKVRVAQPLAPRGRPRSNGK